MPINYSLPQSDADLLAGQMRTTKAQLAKLQREIDSLPQNRNGIRMVGNRSPNSNIV